LFELFISTKNSFIKFLPVFFRFWYHKNNKFSGEIRKLKDTLTKSENSLNKIEAASQL